MNRWDSKAPPRVKVRHFRGDLYLVTFETSQGEQAKLIEKSDVWEEIDAFLEPSDV